MNWSGRPKDVSKLVEKAWEELEAGNYSKALRLGRKLEKARHSSNFEIRALAYSGQGDGAKAEEVLDEGVQLAPGVSGLWLLLGTTCSNNGKLDKALEAYSQAKRAPVANIPVIAYNEAVVMEKQSRFEEALSSLNDVFLDAGSDILLGIAALRLKLLNKMGRFEEVIASEGQIEAFVRDAATEIDGCYVEKDGVDFASPVDQGKSNCLLELLSAKRRLSYPHEALWQLALRAAIIDNSSTDAQWWLRELRGTILPNPVTYQVIITGVSSWDNSLGFFRKYTVVAESEQHVRQYIEEIEQESHAIEDCSVQQGQEVSLPAGIYFVGGYCYFELDE